MPENYAAKFKKFFGGFGAHDKGHGEQPSESVAPESPEQIALEPPEQPAPEPPTQAQPALEEADAFAIPIDNPLALVWDKYGQPGALTLDPQLQAQDGGDVPLKTLEVSFNKVLGELAVLSQRWLDMESSAAQARAESEAAAAAARSATAEAEAPAAPANGSEPDASAPAPSGSDGVPDEPEAENAPDGEAPAIATPQAPLDVDEMGQVLVSRDGMAAWLFLLPPSGNGKRLSMADGQTLLREAHVTAGVDQRALFAALTNKPYFRLCPIASGTPPTEGEDGWTEDHFLRNFVRSIGNSDSGTVDYRAQSNVQSIAKDAVICDIHLPVEGTAGIRVDGVAVPPKPVKAAVVPAGNNTALSEDGTKLLSTMDGFLEFRGGLFDVKNLLNITSDVDYSTGNIDFHGDVAIQGDVREQFSVKATGSITINGLVEAATVEAGGDVVISNGVSGNNQAVIRGAHVRAKHLENCTVYAENLESDYILTSRVFCSDSVLVTGSRGAIIGGQVVAANHIKACCIGIQSGRATEITLGVQPQLREELLANRKALVSLRSKAAELVKRATYLKNRMESQGRPDIRSSAAIQAAGERLSQMTEQEKALLARQTELMNQLNKLNNCRLEGGTVYPGVKLTIGSAVRNIKTVINNCIAIFDTEEHDIKFV
ncbi:hypothetical protein OBV_28430 [Oscillibacter valericigenes Sjm18-20]|nr:hypothetical protein OBV_28430 [Oscillibacter valericigenes Sjm18-20]